MTTYREKTAISIAAVLCLLLLFSCTTTIEFPQPPPGYSSSSSEQILNSSSSSSLGDEDGSSSSAGGARSSSSFYTSLPSSSSVNLPPGEGFCQIGASCIELAAETCIDFMEGTPVSACNLTCSEMDLSNPYYVGYPMNPKPIIRCNGNVVNGSGIDWTPANLTFTTIGRQPFSATVANCNHATVVCGYVNVEYD